jgi:opacity protein-like surface antigen
MTVISAVAALCTATPRPASAQEVGMPVPVGQVMAGYTFMRDLEANDVNFPAGWVFSAAVNPSRWLGVVGEATGSYNNSLDLGFGQPAVEARVYTFMGGPRFFKQAGRIAPFGQILAGAANRRIEGFSKTSFAFQPGGGVTIFLTERVGVRVAGDYRCIVDHDEEFTYTNEIRVVSGFTLHWGAR